MVQETKARDRRSCVLKLSTGAAVVLLISAASSPVGAADVQTSPTSGATCRQVRTGTDYKTICPGPAGYSVIVTNRNNEVIRIGFGRLMEAAFLLENEETSLVWRGTAPFLDKRIEWRMLHGRPVTAIVRIYTLDAQDLQQQQFLIAKVTPMGGCEIARIDASNAGAYATARDIAASQVNNIVCELS